MPTLVAEAADRIVLAGGRPSVRLVLKEIGWGSMRDVCPALAKWKSERGWVAAPAMTAELPQALQDAFRDFAGRAWAGAREEARRELAEVRERLTRERDACHEVYGEAAEHAGELASEVARLQREAESLRRDVDHARRLLDEHRLARDAEARDLRAELLEARLDRARVLALLEQRVGLGSGLN